MKWNKNRKLVALLLLALVLLSSARAMFGLRDRTKGAVMTQKMKTVCVGRFLIDVPQDASVALGRTRVAGFDVESALERTQDYDNRVAARIAALRAERNDAGKPTLELVQDYQGNGFVGKILVYGRWRTSWIEDEQRVYAEGVAVEGFLHKDGTSFGFASSTADRAQVSKLTRLFGQVGTRDEAAIPAQPGLCIGHGFISEPLPADEREMVAMFAALPSHPDVGIAFSSVVGASPGPGLLQRTAAAMAHYSSLRSAVKKLREGARSVNGLSGEELAVKVTERDFSSAFTFDWESRGKPMDVLSPFMTLELMTGMPRPGGKPVQSSLSESALYELWDSMLPSLRVRGAAAPRPAAPRQPPAELGTVAMAGEACPAFGWWQCSEGGNGVGVLGGRRQLLRKGQRIPQALLLPQPRLWEKVRGLQPSYEAGAPSAWTLVDRRAVARNRATAPLAPATTTAAAEPQAAIGPVALGTSVRTGEPCPASGWWRCDDPHALDGARWFAHGSLLPPATHAMPAAWFGKGASGPAVIQRRANWQLVRHARAPDAAGDQDAERPVPEGYPA